MNSTACPAEEIRWIDIHMPYKDFIKWPGGDPSPTRVANTAAAIKAKRDLIAEMGRVERRAGPTLCARPSAIRSAMASPVAGALRMPQTLWPG